MTAASRRTLGPRSAMLRQAVVPVSLVLVAGTAYLLLMASGRVLDPAGFAALTSFYLLSNTVGRGTFAVLELELTRAVPRARARGQDPGAPVRAVARGGAVLAVLVCALILAAGGLLQRVLGGWDGVLLLVLASLTLAVSSFVRGPLAGSGRYGLFATTLTVESGVYLAGAIVLLVAGVGSIEAWMGLLALAPLLGALVVFTPDVRSAVGRLRAAAPAPRVGLVSLAAGSSLYLFSQGVWNLGPVIANGRSADGVLIAAFAASAVLLRAPVMAFPAVQALLLPRLTTQAETGTSGGHRTTPRSAVLAGALLVVWLVGSVVVAPPVVRTFFAVSLTPGWDVLAALALSVALGVVIQSSQTRLLARDGTGLVAVSWAAGVAVLAAGAFGAPDAVTGAAYGQLAAAAVVLVVQTLALRRRRPA